MKYFLYTYRICGATPVKGEMYMKKIVKLLVFIAICILLFLIGFKIYMSSDSMKDYYTSAVSEDGKI